MSAWILYVSGLERQRAEPPEDLADQVRHVQAALADNPDHALLREGDEVWVDEKNNPWVVGRWRGFVAKIHVRPNETGKGWYLQFRIRPVFPDESDPDSYPLPFRVKPLPEQRVRGLELAREDRLELIARTSR